MKPVAIVSMIALVTALLLPVFWMSRKEPEVPVHYADSDLIFTVKGETDTTTVTMADYLPGVLAGEMPALFEMEALKAQAVAARTYILYRMATPTDKHPEAVICDDPSCCKAFLSADTLEEKWGKDFDKYYEKMCTAVRETDGEYLRYAGSPIQAVFHSSSPGQTQASADIWNDCPYLLSVDSPETAADVPDFTTDIYLTPEDFRKALLAEYPDIPFTDTPADWLEETVLNDSGRVETTTVCGTAIPGTSMRTVFSLRSNAYTLEYTEAGTFHFTVTGYGHGVGMSQYGANVYAKNGYTYDQILAHYYSGTELVSG